MGQRLNIEIVNGDTCLANAYYHWSGYTLSACDLTMKILDAMGNLDQNDSKRGYIRYLAYKPV